MSFRLPVTLKIYPHMLNSLAWNINIIPRRTIFFFQDGLSIKNTDFSLSLYTARNLWYFQTSIPNTMIYIYFSSLFSSAWFSCRRAWIISECKTEISGIIKMIPCPQRHSSVFQIPYFHEIIIVFNANLHTCVAHIEFFSLGSFQELSDIVEYIGENIGSWNLHSESVVPIVSS